MGPLWVWLLLLMVSSLGLVLITPALLAAFAAPPAPLPPDLVSEDVAIAAEPPPPESESHDIPPEEVQRLGLEKLALGLTTEAVEGLLGRPRFMSMVGSKGESWSYPLREIYKEDPSIEGALNLTFEEGLLIKKALDTPRP